MKKGKFSIFRTRAMKKVVVKDGEEKIFADLPVGKASEPVIECTHPCVHCGTALKEA